MMFDSGCCLNERPHLNLSYHEHRTLVRKRPPISLHRMRKLLHRRSRRSLGDGGRAPADCRLLGNLDWGSPLVSYSFGRQPAFLDGVCQRRLHLLRPRNPQVQSLSRAPHAMPNLALLAIQHKKSPSLGRRQEDLPRSRHRRFCQPGRNREQGKSNQDLGLRFFSPREVPEQDTKPDRLCSFLGRWLGTRRFHSVDAPFFRN